MLPNDPLKGCDKGLRVGYQSVNTVAALRSSPWRFDAGHSSMRRLCMIQSTLTQRPTRSAPKRPEPSAAVVRWHGREANPIETVGHHEEEMSPLLPGGDSYKSQELWSYEEFWILARR